MPKAILLIPEKVAGVAVEWMQSPQSEQTPFSQVYCAQKISRATYNGEFREARTPTLSYSRTLGSPLQPLGVLTTDPGKGMALAGVHSNYKKPLSYNRFHGFETGISRTLG